jgi:rhamnosyltransferase
MIVKTFHESLRVALIIPTCNAARNWHALHEGISRQSITPQQILVVDSSSSDGTEALVRDAGWPVISIAQRDFNHGGTRQLAAEHLPDAEILIYLTQDAVPFDKDAFSNILAIFDDPVVGAAFGRQLPRLEAGPLEAHARYYNYPPVSRIHAFECRKTLGFKAVFASNSFAAYRRTALDQVGGFPLNALVSEETIVFARLQRIGWKTAYVADASVIHSHGYTIREQFCRYFDIAAGYARENWIEKEYRAPNSEGRRFVISEIRYLFPARIHLIPLAALHTLAKGIGYQLGRLEKHLPLPFKRALSNQKSFWKGAWIHKAGDPGSCARIPDSKVGSGER